MYLEISEFVTVNVILSTLLLTVAVAFLPLELVAVIVAVPMPTAFRLPLLSTVMTLLSLLDHLTLLSVALLGEIVADKEELLPIIKSNDDLFNEIELTATVEGVEGVEGAEGADGCFLIQTALIVISFSTTIPVSTVFPDSSTHLSNE